MTKFLYVSRSAIPHDGVDAAIADIVATAVSWNEAHGLTGALMYADGYFAQFLEGSDAGIAAVRERISNDNRHTELRVLDTGWASQRRFVGWALAYCGPASFLKLHLQRLHVTGGRDSDRERLMEMLWQFTNKLAPGLGQSST